MISPLPRVVVLGAGIAGLEAAFLLEHRLSGRADVHVIYDDDTFLLQPNLVYLPFGADPSASTLHLSDTLARKRIPADHGPVEGVDTDAGRVHVGPRRQLAYEHLVIATGAEAWPQAVPGLHEHALCIGDPAAMSLLHERFLGLRGRAREGARQRVLFVIPRHNRWSVPLYEVALMFDTWLRRERAREQVELALLTHEAAFAEPAGPRMHELLTKEFADRGIEASAGEHVTEVRAHAAAFAAGRVERFDLLVAAPPQRASFRYDGLPLDDHGFIRVENDTRQVVGHPEIYAPGDAGDFPLKDPFLALLEADAAAEHIAAVITGRQFKRPFDPVTMQIIDMLDKAAFAQVPLAETGDPDHPIGVRPGAEADYKVDLSHRWRAAKRVFSSYLLMQFAAGEPFQAGPGWRFLDLGVHAMAGML
jgi:NADH dehydrogenase FAD-containing subunit